MGLIGDPVCGYLLVPQALARESVVFVTGERARRSTVTTAGGFRQAAARRLIFTRR